MKKIASLGTGMSILFAIFLLYMSWVLIDVSISSLSPQVYQDSKLLIGGVMGDSFVLEAALPVHITVIGEEGSSWLENQSNEKLAETDGLGRYKLFQGSLPPGKYTIQGAPVGITLEAQETITVTKESATRLKGFYIFVIVAIVVVDIWFVILAFRYLISKRTKNEQNS